MRGLLASTAFFGYFRLLRAPANINFGASMFTSERVAHLVQFEWRCRYAHTLWFLVALAIVTALIDH